MLPEDTTVCSKQEPAFDFFLSYRSAKSEGGKSLAESVQFVEAGRYREQFDTYRQLSEAEKVAYKLSNLPCIKTGGISNPQNKSAPPLQYNDCISFKLTGIRGEPLKSLTDDKLTYGLIHTLNKDEFVLFIWTDIADPGDQIQRDYYAGELMHFLQNRHGLLPDAIELLNPSLFCWLGERQHYVNPAAQCFQASRDSLSVPQSDIQLESAIQVDILPGTDLNDEWEEMQQSKTTDILPAENERNKSPQIKLRYVSDLSEAGYETMKAESRIWADEDIPPPPICLSIQNNGQKNTIGTLGNFSVVIGKAKSRKTFAISIALAAALKRDLVLNRFAGSFDQNKQTVLLFDTEQSRYHVLKVVKRICQLAGHSSPPNLIVHSLRQYSTIERLAFIERCIAETQHVGLVVIDGIRDTVSDINDNNQATERVADLLRWTEQRNIHIMTIIHVNKSNDLIRGTIGTELQNKAETVIMITVDQNNKDISIVSPDVCRDPDFEPFAFSIDKEGLPYLVEDWQSNQKLTSRDKAKESESTSPGKITPIQLTSDTHQSILRRAFTNVEPGKYQTTYLRIKAAAEYFGYKFGDNKAKEFTTYYKDAGYLVNENTLYKLNPTRFNPLNSTPDETSLV